MTHAAQADKLYRADHYEDRQATSVPRHLTIESASPTLLHLYFILGPEITSWETSN